MCANICIDANTCFVYFFTFLGPFLCCLMWCRGERPMAQRMGRSGSVYKVKDIQAWIIPVYILYCTRWSNLKGTCVDNLAS